MHRADSLAADFPPVNEAEWRAAASRSGGRPGPRNVSDDGIPVGPIYARRRGALPVVRPETPEPWRVVTRLSATGAEALIAEATEDCAGGSVGVEIALAGSVHPLAVVSPVPDAIAGRLIETLPKGSTLRIDAGARGATLALAAVASARSRGVALAVSSDEMAVAAIGRTKADLAPFARLAAALDAAGAPGLAATADGRIWHAAGASEVQELAAVLASVVEHLRAAETPARPLARVGIALAADADQFITIAKFRAMRLLVARVSEAMGADAAPVQIHAETAWRMMSRREPRMNILRAGSAAFAAAAGGADSIAALPFDALDGPSDPAARRLARNTQLILTEEVGLHRFADPAAGSGAVEALTDALAEAAWERFQRIEAAGGLSAEILSGSLIREIAATRDTRLGRMRSGTLKMVGIKATGEAPPPAASDALAFIRVAEAGE